MEDVKTEETRYSLDTGLEFLKDLLGKYIGKSTLYNAIYKGDLTGGTKDENGEWSFPEGSMLAYATLKHGYRAPTQAPQMGAVPLASGQTRVASQQAPLEEKPEDFHRGEGDLSVEEACLLLEQLLGEKVSTSTIHNAQHRGTIFGSYKIDRRRFFPKASIVQYAKDYRGYQDPSEVSSEAVAGQKDEETGASDEQDEATQEETEYISSLQQAEIQEHEVIDQEKEHVLSILTDGAQEAEEVANVLGIPVSNGYDVLAVIHGQTLLGEQEATQLPVERAMPAQSEETQYLTSSLETVHPSQMASVPPVQEERGVLFPICYRCGRQFERESDFRPEKFIVNGVLTYRDVCQDGRCDPIVVAASAARVAALQDENAQLNACLVQTRKLCLGIIHAIDRQLVFQPDKEG